MTRRAVIAGIVVFWLGMNGALVHLWLRPETSDILSVPVSHVFKQVFLHEQTSSLAISQNGRRVGGIVLRPRREDDKNLRVLDFTGNIILKLPVLNQQPFNWRGTMELGRSLALRSLKLHVDTRGVSAEAMTVDLEVRPYLNTLTYNVRQNQAPVIQQTVTLDEAGARSTMRALGIDPSVLGGLGGNLQGIAGDFQFFARQSQLEIRGDRVEVFRLTLSQGGATMIVTDISQLGQVLRVKTAFGVKMAPDDILP